jgi:hypothetical protein
MKLQAPTNFVERVGRQVVDRHYGTAVEEEKRLDTVVATTAGGAALGGLAGLVWGFRSQEFNKVNEGRLSHEINHPTYTGWSHHAHEDWSRSCTTQGSGEDAREVCTDELDGWRHRYTPHFTFRNVGSYEEPVFRNSGIEPLQGAFFGAIGGGLLGLGVGIAANALRRTVESDAYAHSKPVSQDTATLAGWITLGSTGVGIAGGAFIGHASGILEQAQKQIHDRTWSEPIYQRVKLGDIPRDYYQHNWGWGFARSGSDFRNGTEGVYRDVPTYNSDGTPAMREVTRSFDTGRYGPGWGTFLGGVVGGGIGLATGVAASTLYKMTQESEPAAK